MSGLLGPTGNPISTTDFQNKKAKPPIQGQKFASWAGDDIQHMTLPGGGVVQFDLSKLRVEDFRNMRDHYQVNASLAILSFMQHQAAWKIECADKKIAEAATAMMTDVWTGLNRGLSQANWAGYSPMVIDWENDIEGKKFVVDKFRDLYPEDCRVNWDTVTGWAPPGHTGPKLKVYDGIKYARNPQWPIPVDNTLWYPLLMENGDYYGKKLLRPAFTSWYFSILLHLFANRYYERFGEPVPVGRAPFDDQITSGDKTETSQSFMMNALTSLRNRSVVVLPSDKTSLTGSNQSDYDYDIDYLESQMRGADFERYMTRLDEEISIGLFTPILLLRTADVGSYSLGASHMQMYQWMLNALNDDRADYINKYVLSRFTDYNFSPKAPRPRLSFRRVGNMKAEVLASLITALVQNGKASADLEELGQFAGLTLTEVRETLGTPAPEEDDPDAPDPDAPVEPADAARRGGATSRGVRPRAHVDTVLKEVTNRIRGQVASHFKKDTFGPGVDINLGYKRRMYEAFDKDGYDNPVARVNDLYATMDVLTENIQSVPIEDWNGHEDVTRALTEMLEANVSRVLSS